MNQKSSLREVPQFVSGVLTGNNPGTSFRYRSGDGTEYVASVAPVPGTDWRAVAIIPAQTIVVNARKNAHLAIAAVGIALATALAAAAFLIRSIERPIRSIAAAARARMRGDHSVQATESGAEEVAVVAKQFNIMLNQRDDIEEALRRSHERSQLVESVVSDGIWHESFDTNEVYLSPRWKGILGFADDELPNTRSTFLELIHPDDRDAVADRRRAYLQLGGNSRLISEFRLRHKDGGYRWIESRGTVVRDAAGRPVRTIGTITDIDGRKRTQDLIEESRNNLARAEKMARLGHYKYEVGTNTLSWSEGAYYMHGKSPASFRPTLGSVLALVHPDDRPKLEQHRHDILAGIEPPPVTVRASKADGQTIYVEAWGRPLRSADGAIIGIFGTIQDVTAHRLADEALRQSQERYRLIESVVTDGVWDVNFSSDECYWSPHWKSILGYADYELQSTRSTFLDLVHPDDKALVVQKRQEYLELGEDRCLTAEFRMRRKDGDYRWVLSRGTVVRDAEGHPLRMLGTITDIDDRKRAQALIAEGRDNLARAERMALLGHVRYELKSGKYSWSEGTYRIMGKSPDTFSPTLANSLDFIHPGDLPKLEQYRRDAFAGQDLPRITVRMLKDDGQPGYLEIWSVPTRDQDGTVTGMFATAQDVTARTLAAEALRQSQERSSLVESAVNDGIWDWCIATGKEYVSPRWKGILGYADDELSIDNSTFFDLVHPDDRAAVAAATQAHIEENKPYSIDYRLRHKNGGYRWVHSRGKVVRDADNRPVRMLGAVTDITERKQIEYALAEANRGLEERVAERTSELAREMNRREQAQTKLAQVQKMEAVGQLTAGIAHDFNNLLAVIKGGLEFVEEAAARGLPADPELIDSATRATRRGAELVRRLLAFSRQAPLEAEPARIDQLVLDTLRLLQRTLGEEIEIVTRLEATTATVRVDRNQFANALLNLALNARDAMPQGGQLTIATAYQDPRGAAAEGAARWPMGGTVSLTITDTGVGMNEEVRNRVFEPFFTTKPDGLGSGLGLSMVQGFVEQTGGHIEVDSKVGRGTAIAIRLPTIDAVGEVDDAQALADWSANGKDKTVLLVEDDPDVRIVTAHRLRKLGYRVHAVASGTEAIDLIESPANIDIALTDIVLPGPIDGVDLVKEAMRARPGIGVLCMSGYDPTQTHRKWLMVQNIEFLQKPFSSTQLAQALEAVQAV